MTWVLILILALAAFCVVAFVFKPGAGGREAVGAALLLGIAGYALQGRPAQPSSPRQSSESQAVDGKAVVGARLAVRGKATPPSDRWVVVSDALARNGQFGEAAEVLRAGMKGDPKNADAWVAMGNALVAHADGQLTPASLYAYKRALKADPDDPGGPFFLGMAMAQAGQFADARALWAGMLERAPKDAPWRGLIEERLGQLDALIAQQAR